MAIIMTLDPKRNNYGHDIEERTVKVVISKQGLAHLLIPFQILLTPCSFKYCLPFLCDLFFLFKAKSNCILEHLSFY